MAEGFALNVDTNFLNNLELADKRIEKIAKTSQETSSAFIQSFNSMNAKGLQPFIDKLSEAQKAFSNIGGSKNANKAIDDVNKIAQAVGKMGENNGFKTIEQSMLSLMNRIRLLKGEMDLFRSLEKGNLLNTADYANIGKVADELNRLMRQYSALDETMKRLRNGDSAFKGYLDDLNGTSISAKRAKHEMDKLNESFRNGTSQLQKKADAEDAAARAADRRVQAEKRTQQQNNAKNLNAYNQALKANEATITQRTNKIAKLRQVESLLAQDESKYATQLSKVRSEIERLTQANKKQAESAEKVRKSHRNLMDTAGQLQRKLALVFSVSAIQGYLNKLIQIRGEFEMQQKSLQILLQNKDEADKLWQQTIDLAVRSPFRVKQLVSYTRQLAAYRIESDKLHDTTKRLADVSAGLGVDMSRIILAFGQVRAANYLRGTELRQFTEAGIPMLDELAKYFTELEGRAVSAGDVFERISKRMVAFSDVEEVFHRMTNAGGVFYKMQEEQSKTLQGMISNLHDSIDLMLNDIGKTNDGVLKGTIETLKEIVENWKAFSIVLQQVGAVVGLITLRKAILSLVALSPKLYAMAGGLSALTAGSMTFSMQAKRMAVSIRALTRAMMANPLFAGGAILAAILSVVHALWQYNNAVKASNEIYDEVSKREVRRLDELEALNETIQENNKIIKESTGKTQEKSKAERENAEALETLKNKYPELYDKIVKQEDGTLNLNDAIEEQNRLIELNISLQQQAKGGWFQDTLGENYTDAIEAQADLKGSINDVKAAAIDMQSKLVYAFQQGNIPEDTYEEVIKLVKALKSAKDFDGITKAYSDLFKFARQLSSSEGRMPILDLVSDITKVYTDAKNASNDYKDSLEDLQDNLDNQMGTFKVGITEQIELDPEKGKEKAADWVDGQLEELGVYDKEIKKWAEDYIVKQVGVELVFIDKKSGEAPLDDWAIRVNDAITEVNNKIKEQRPDIPDNWLFPLVKSGQTKEQYLNFAKGILDIAKATYTEGQKIEDEAMVSITNALKPYANEVENILNIQQKTTPKGQGKDWISEVVKSVRDAHKEYLSLNKTLDAASARQMTLAKYADLFREAAQHTQFKGMNLEDFDFTTEEGTIAALESMLDALPESAKNARLTIQKALKDITGERTIRLKVEEDKALIDQIEDMFSGYEMSIELQKLNIPPDLAKQLFNVDSIDLSSIRSKIESDLAKARTVGGQEDLVKELEKKLEKVDELEDEQLKERLKKYSKYLVTAMGERVKIKMEEVRQINEIENLNDLTQSQKELAKQGVRKESQAQLDKLEWEEFKDSGMYVQLFEDLEYASTKSLSAMRDQLILLKGNLKNLDADDLKHLYDQIEKLDEELSSRNPFKTMVVGIDDYVKAVKNSKGLEKELAIQQSWYNLSKDQESKIDEQLAIKRSEYEQKSKSGQLTQEEHNEYIKIINDLESQLSLTRAIVAERQKLLGKAQEEVDNNNKVKKSFKESAQEVGAYISEAASALPNIASDMENVFGTMSDGARDTIDSISTIAGGVGSAIQGFASQNYIQAIAGVAQALGGIFAIGDKKKERQIQREIKLVEDLERAYEKLKTKIDEAYSINTLQSSGKQAKKNIESQIDSYERMIQAEEDKKKTDKDRIKEWELAIEDLMEQKAELDKQLVSTATGGIMDDVLSASQEFTDAWLSAFQETGDGLSGLEENFRETMLEMVKQQASMLISQSYIERWKKQLQQYINPDDLELSTDEAKKWVDAVSNSLPQLNQALENYFNAMQQAGVDISGGSGELSGLQRGIQGVTEETAQIIEAYLNSIRFFVAEQTTYLSQIAASFTNTEMENPMVSQLRIIAQQTTAINTLLQSLVRGGHSLGGVGLKVFMS